MKSKQHLKSIDLVEISRSVVESSKMDPSRSKFDDFEISNEVYKVLVNLVILVNFKKFHKFRDFVNLVILVSFVEVSDFGEFPNWTS